jgi:hypothetical protein
LKRALKTVLPTYSFKITSCKPAKAGTVKITPMKNFFTLFLFCFIHFGSFAQSAYKAEEFQAALMETKTGAMVVYSGKQQSFTLNFNGKVTPGEEPNFVTVDNKILQSAIIPFQAKLDFKNLDQETQKKYLLGHMNFELDYIKETLNTDVLNEKHEFIPINNKLFIFWSYDMPKANESIAMQCYLVTICFDQMLILNSPVEKGKSQKEIKDFLTTTAKTLKLNNQPIDLDKLYKELNK